MIIITGGGGFIGNHLREALNKTMLPYISVNERCEDTKNLSGTLIHLAASTSERESYINPVKYIDNNIKNLALLIKNNNFDSIIFPSSATVYNDKGEVDPSSIYGITKLACENIIL